jgi:hypothetical protein
MHLLESEISGDSVQDILDVTYLESRSHYGLAHCIIRKDGNHHNGTGRRTRKSIKTTHIIQCGSLRRIYT